MSEALPAEVEMSGELGAVLDAQRAVAAAEAAATGAQRLLVRALREAGADPDVIRLVQGAERPSLVPARLPVPAGGHQADEVVRVAQHGLVEAIVVHLTALDELDLAEQRLDGVLPQGLRGARPVLRRLAVTGQPAHDFPALARPTGDLLASRAVCGRPRTLAHHALGGAATGDVVAPPPRCRDCRDGLRSDGPFGPEVGPIAQIARADGAATVDAEPEADQADAGDGPEAESALPSSGLRPQRPPRPSPGARPVPGPRLAAVPDEAAGLPFVPRPRPSATGDPGAPGAARAARAGRESFGERHARVWRVLVVVRTILVLLVVALVFALVVAGITGHWGPLEGLIHR